MKTAKLELSLAQLKNLSEMVERAIDETEILCTPSPALDKMLAEKREILDNINAAIKEIDHD